MSTPMFDDRAIVGLSLIQPWATLMAVGAKKIETRSWRTWYRGRVAVHASKGFKREYKQLCTETPFVEVLVKHGYRSTAELPLGCIVAVGRLVGCFPVTHLAPDPMERAFGDYTPGRYGWVFEDVEPLDEPIPAKGALGLWAPSPEVIERLLGVGI